MKDIIKELYSIDVLTFIKVSDKVYKIKSSDGDYALKYIERNNLDVIIEKLKIIKVNFLVYPLKNTSNQYVSSFEGINFIILPWIDEGNAFVKDLKLKFFLNSLADLHNRSFYTIRVNESFFDETYYFIANKIDKTTEYIESYISKIERLNYKSPSQWLFLLNYPIYVDALSKANKSLEDFKDKSEKKDSVRIALTYNDFDYNHVMVKEEKILGIENIELAPPVYDVFYTFSSLNETNVDNKMYYQNYFNKFILDEYEKDWLLALLYIPKIENLSLNEGENIKEVTNSLNYIRNSGDIAKLIINKNEISE
jgi:hypothetical protein